MNFPADFVIFSAAKSMKAFFTILSFLSISLLSAQRHRNAGSRATDSTAAKEISAEEPAIEAPEEEITVKPEPVPYLYPKSLTTKELLAQNPDLKGFNFNHDNKAESYPSLSNDGLHLFFVHNQSIDWIFYTSRKTLQDDWEVPVPLRISGVDFGGSADGTSARLLTATFAPDTNNIYVSGIWNGKAHLLHLKKEGGPKGAYAFDFECSFQDALGAPQELDFISNMSFCNEEREMFVYINRTQMCYSREADQIWKFKYMVGSEGEYIGRVSEDGKSLILSIGSEGEKSSRQQIIVVRRTDYSEVFNMDKAFLLYELNSRDAFLNQPAYCQSSGELVLVINNEHYWDSNNIFFVHADVSADLPHYVPESMPATSYAEIVETDAEPMLEREYIQEPVALPSDTKRVNEFVAPSENQKLIETATGVIESKISIGMPFPNPASQIIHFYYQSQGIEATESMKVFVHDNSGKMVYQGILPSGSREGSVNVSGLSPGIYTLSVAISGLQSDGIRFSVSR